jgi:molecular chaperone GrpE
MSPNELNTIKEIENRISKLQKDYVLLQDKYNNSQKNFERKLDDLILKIIEIEDLMELSHTNLISDAEIPSNFLLIMNKIKKKIAGVLTWLQVQPIELTDRRIIPGKVRVVETQKVAGDIPPGTIVNICRKGYHRGNKIIRPADVITAEISKVD